MQELSHSFIKSNIAHSDVIFNRGENIFLLGNYSLIDEDGDDGEYSYAFDGNYGDYDVSVTLKEGRPEASCTCPFPRYGCKHIVAACLDIERRRKRETELQSEEQLPDDYLTPEEIRNIALDSREERAKKEPLVLEPGETYKGRHTVKTPKGKEYTVTIFNPEEKTGHCTCPDFATNHLDTCKHLIFAYNRLSKNKDFLEQSKAEVFPFIHFTWNSRLQKPLCYFERIDDAELLSAVQDMFNEKGLYTRESLNRLYTFYSKRSDQDEVIQFDDYLLERLEEYLYQKEVAKLKKRQLIDFSFLHTELYPYQDEGVQFAVFRKAAIIADEMGLGKTIQAIAVAILKKQIFGFKKVLIISPSSLKSQWKQEIEKFTDYSAVVVSGGRKKRQKTYFESEAYFKITNYEAVLRDITVISRWRPDFVILDEAQRIKNFETKTHQAVQSIPHNHSLVITGTPLENKLEDLYSIVQFSEPTLLTPLWAFAANHFNLSKTRKNKVLGYKNLNTVYQKVQPLLIRRKKVDVFDSLPEKIENNYYLDLSKKQEDIHQGYMMTLFRILQKKVLTPIDVDRMQKTLMAMRMVCNSTYLIDKKTNISPKLVELVSLLKEVVLENGRKVIIFSEWTTMTYLIGKALSEMGIDFVEFTGKVPVEKRQLLIDEFRDNPDCMVFLSTDAGGVGLNLQNTDCLINFELPWNPAKLNQRIGRIHRIGQTSEKINVINMIMKNSIEEKVYAGINLKQELFDAALEGVGDAVDLSSENKNRFVNQIRAMFGEEEIAAAGEADRYDTANERPELDEQTPHYLNPEIFKEKETEIDISGEEFAENEFTEEGPSGLEDRTAGGQPGGTQRSAAPQQGGHLPADQTTEDRHDDEGKSAGSHRSGEANSPDREPTPDRAPGPGRGPTPEQMETVLNQGMAFLNTLSQMATGRPLSEGDSGKSVEIDRETGEVVMRFKLPGF